MQSILIFLVISLEAYCLANEAHWNANADWTIANLDISFCRSSELRETKASCRSKRERFDEARCRCWSDRPKKNPASSNHGQRSPRADCLLSNIGHLSHATFMSHAEKGNWPAFECGLQLAPVVIPQPSDDNLIRTPAVIYGTKCPDLPQAAPGWRCVAQNVNNHRVQVNLFSKREVAYLGHDTVHVQMPTSCHMVQVTLAESCGPEKYFDSDTSSCRCRNLRECRNSTAIWSEETCRCECQLIESSCELGFYADQRACECRRLMAASSKDH